MTEKSEIEKLVPGREVTLASGQVVEVKELTFGESMRAHKAPGGAAFLKAFEEIPDGDVYALLAVASRHPEWWGYFLQRTTGLTLEQFEALPTRDGLKLALEVLAENAGFFGLAASLTPRETSAPAASPTSSPSSSATDTPAPTS